MDAVVSETVSVDTVASMDSPVSEVLSSVTAASADPITSELLLPPTGSLPCAPQADNPSAITPVITINLPLILYLSLCIYCNRTLPPSITVKNLTYHCIIVASYATIFTNTTLPPALPFSRYTARQYGSRGVHLSDTARTGRSILKVS